MKYVFRVYAACAESGNSARCSRRDCSCPCAGLRLRSVGTVWTHHAGGSLAYRLLFRSQHAETPRLGAAMDSAACCSCPPWWFCSLPLQARTAAASLRVGIATIIYLGIAALFFLSGHSLAVTGARRGSPVPWILIASCFSLPFLLFRPVTITSTSMADTLLTGDFVLANRFDRQAANGKLIAFRYPLDGTQIFIRRVAGMPGDRIHFAAGRLIRNGTLVEEPYIRLPSARRSDSFDNFPHGVDAQTLQSAGREMLRSNVQNGDIVVPPPQIVCAGRCA